MFSRSALLVLVGVTVFSSIKCEVYRLPKNVKPSRYFLTTEPQLRDSDLWEPIPYTGSVVMELQALENTRNVTFHQVDLKIDNGTITIVSSSGEEINVKGTSCDLDTETYTVELGEELKKGETYNLTIGNFTGHLGNGEGFFRAFYWKENTEPRGLAATHFEPTGARRAFPCFDEPSLKAKFIVSLIRKGEYSSVSNENLDTTEDLGDGRFKDTFKETPLMPSFTLAFAVSDYKSTEKLERHRILARPEAIKNGDWKFSLEIAVTTLKALEEYTGIDFVIDKMDQIAIPDAFFHEHAMENWGLVVYGESHLMRTNKSRAEDYKRSTCYIAHEFAHQWFGNLVTPAWWDYLWIGESFAAYFQFHIADIIKPSWRLRDQFLVDMVHVALKQEERRGAHALNYEIEYSGQYPPFHIMYEKGSSIIRMMEHALTHDVFRRGLQIYLQKNKFGNAVPADLYAALQEAVDDAGVNGLLNNMTVAKIMRTWDSSRGFPVLTVTRNYETGAVTLEQKSRFDHDNESTTWIIPVNFAFSADDELNFTKTTADYWLTGKAATLNNNFPTDGWLLVNKQQTGYYRVNYDRENWERLIQFLNSDSFTLIHPLSRAQLIEDAFNLAYKDELLWEIPLRLCEYIVREKDYIPLVAFYNALGNYIFIYNNYGNTGERNPKNFRYFGNYTLTNDLSVENGTEYDYYKEYVKTTLGHVNETLGFEPKPRDTHLDELQRTKFRRFYYYFEDNET